MTAATSNDDCAHHRSCLDASMDQVDASATRAAPATTATATASNTAPLANPLRKLLLTRADLDYFHAHPLYTHVLLPFLEVLNASVQGLPTTIATATTKTTTETTTETTTKTALHVSPFVDRFVADIMNELRRVPQQFPPEECADKKMRFGNPAFRQFYDYVAQHAFALLRNVLPRDAVTDEETAQVAGYLCESFGDRNRIDYGTGHELNFLCVLLCLRQLGLIGVEDYPAVVLRIFTSYLSLMRNLQFEYWLEPAGSHGVWGLDDYHFLPFLFGSSQLIGHKHLRPRSIHDKEIVSAYAKDYLYLACIQFVNEVKTASLAWHSPMLNDISAVKTWEKTNQGMLKMYKGEVLAKLPIMQHFLFGELLAGSCGPRVWEAGVDGGSVEWTLFQPPSTRPTISSRDKKVEGELEEDASVTTMMKPHKSVAPDGRPVVKYVTGPSGQQIPIYAAHHVCCNHGDSQQPEEEEEKDVDTILHGVYALGQEAPTCCGMRVPSAIAAKASGEDGWRGGMIPFD